MIRKLGPYIAFFIAIVSTNLVTQGQLFAEVRCDALEVIQADQSYRDMGKYNALICKGMDLMEIGNYEEAVNTFVSAMEIDFLDIPNFELYTRLALAHRLNGEIDQARDILEKAELSLKVFGGIYRCDHNHVWALVDSFGVIVDSIFSGEIIGRMCGEAYDYYYNFTEFSQYLHYAKLIEFYLSTEFDVNNVPSVK